jgi:GT2 family glycosyltransferase
MPDCTIIITTKNRVEELRDALHSCLEQEGELEVIVVDDGSTDTTSAMVANEFPTVRCIRHEQSMGLVASRNEATLAAASDFVFSIDDDAVFVSENTVLRSLECFKDERVGAVAMPYVNVNISDHVYHVSPDDGILRATYTFTGTAHAHRKELFLRLNGYRPYLFHWGEERDYCLRLMNAGYRVAVGVSEPIQHFTSPKRDTKFQNVFLYRNQILFASLNAPTLYLPVLWLFATAWSLVDGLKSRMPGVLLKGLWRGYRDSVRYLSERDAVSASAFKLAMLLRKVGLMPMDSTYEAANID